MRVRLLVAATTLVVCVACSQRAETLLAPNTEPTVSLKIPPPWESMSNCGTFYGCGQPITDFGAPSGGYTLLNQYNAAGLQKCKDEWDPYCLPRALTLGEWSAVLQEVTRLKDMSDQFCKQMGTLGEEMLNQNQVFGYDEPDAPAGLSDGSITFADSYVDPATGERHMHIGAFQLTGNFAPGTTTRTGPQRKISMTEFASLFNHELIHLAYGIRSDNNSQFKMLRQICG